MTNSSMTRAEIRKVLSEQGLKAITTHKFNSALKELGIAQRGASDRYDADETQLIIEFLGGSIGSQSQDALPTQTSEQAEVGALATIGQAMAPLSRIHDVIDMAEDMQAKQMVDRVQQCPKDVVSRVALKLEEPQLKKPVS